MCPVYKEGDKQSVSNCCPISLTCIVSKLLEKIVHKHLTGGVRYVRIS